MGLMISDMASRRYSKRGHEGSESALVESLSGRRAVWLALVFSVGLFGCSRRELPAHQTAQTKEVAVVATVEPSATATSSAHAIEARGGWEPATTYAVVVGVLTFADPRLASFSDRHRKDQELADTLVARGVPRDHLTVLLDADATASAVFSALEAAAKRAPPGSTLLFYYAGHGGKDDSGAISFVAYDAAPKKPERELSMSRIRDVIVTAFGGDKVLLLADCCYSGGLSDVAHALGEKGKPSLALTSAESSNTSTENWTFTQTVIDALRGEALFDHDGDGVVALSELVDEERDAMKFRENQRFGFENAGLPLEWRMTEPRADSAASLRAVAPVGSYVRAERPRAGYGVARIVGAHADDLDVQFYDYSDAALEKVSKTKVRPIEFTRYPVGAKISVTWEGKVWPAEVTKVDGDFEYITYPGWPSYWDEWILSDRVVTRQTPGGRIGHRSRSAPLRSGTRQP